MSTLARATLTTKELKPAVPAVTEQRVTLEISVEEAALLAVLLGKLHCNNPLTNPYGMYMALIHQPAVKSIAFQYQLVQVGYAIPTFNLVKV